MYCQRYRKKRLITDDLTICVDGSEENMKSNMKMKLKMKVNNLIYLMFFLTKKVS